LGLAFAGRNRDFLCAQLCLRLLERHLEFGLLALERAFAPAEFADPLLKLGDGGFEVGDLVLAAENRARGFARAIRVTAGVNAVRAEQFTTKRDEMEGAFGVFPGGGGACE